MRDWPARLGHTKHALGVRVKNYNRHRGALVKGHVIPSEWRVQLPSVLTPRHKRFKRSAFHANLFVAHDLGDFPIVWEETGDMGAGRCR
jgi:hypothetical protein